MAKTLREQLVGAWKLVSYVEKPVDGSQSFYPMGEEPQGIIMYTPDGYMSAQLMRPGRPKFASGDWFAAHLKRLRKRPPDTSPIVVLFTQTMPKTLTHSMFVSLFPNWLGQTQPRVVTIEGDTLHLSTEKPIKSGGKETMSYLKWKRAEPIQVLRPARYSADPRLLMAGTEVVNEVQTQNSPSSCRAFTSQLLIL